MEGPQQNFYPETKIFIDFKIMYESTYIFLNTAGRSFKHSGISHRTVTVIVHTISCTTFHKKWQPGSMLDSFIAKMYVYIYQKHTEKIQNDLSLHK